MFRVSKHPSSGVLKIVNAASGTGHNIGAATFLQPVGIFHEGEDFRSDHGLGRLVEFRFKGPPGTTSSYITNHIIGTT